jgi:hypothetical protein
MSLSGGQGHVAGPSGTPSEPVMRWRREFPGEEQQLGELQRLESLLPGRGLAGPYRGRVAITGAGWCVGRDDP